MSDLESEYGLKYVSHWMPLPPHPYVDECEGQHVWTWMPKNNAACMRCGIMRNNDVPKDFWPDKPVETPGWGKFKKEIITHIESLKKEGK